MQDFRTSTAVRAPAAKSNVLPMRDADRAGPGDRQDFPEKLAELGRDAESMCMLLDGLKAHYLDALASGRIEVWKKVALGIIELAVQPDIEPRDGAPV